MSLYNNVTQQAYNLYKGLYATRGLRYYVNYGIYLGTACLPKITYQNAHEPEYTKATVKYNAPIVAAMFATTLFMIQQNKNQDWSQ